MGAVSILVEVLHEVGVVENFLEMVPGVVVGVETVHLPAMEEASSSVGEVLPVVAVASGACVPSVAFPWDSAVVVVVVIAVEVVGVVVAEVVVVVAQGVAEAVQTMLGAWGAVEAALVYQEVEEACQGDLVEEVGDQDGAWAVEVVGVVGYQVAFPSVEEACWKVVALEVVGVDAYLV